MARHAVGAHAGEPRTVAAALAALEADEPRRARALLDGDGAARDVPRELPSTTWPRCTTSTGGPATPGRAGNRRCPPRAALVDHEVLAAVDPLPSEVEVPSMGCCLDQQPEHASACVREGWKGEDLAR